MNGTEVLLNSDERLNVHRETAGTMLDRTRRHHQSPAGQGGAGHRIAWRGSTRAPVRSEPEVEGKAPLGLVEEAEVSSGSDGQVLDRLRRRLECELSTKKPPKKAWTDETCRRSSCIIACCRCFVVSCVLSSYLRTGRTERGACLPITSVTRPTTRRLADGTRGREWPFRSVTVGRCRRTSFVVAVAEAVEKGGKCAS